MNEKDNSATPILVCGLLAIDIVFDVPAIPTDAIKYKANKVSMVCGGGGCYASIAIKRLGGMPSLLARVGNDDYGKFILSALGSEGIDCANIKIHNDTQTPISSISVDPNGERQIVNYRSTEDAPFTGQFSFNQQPRAVLVDTRWIEGSVAALNYAKYNKIPGVIDAEAPTSAEAMKLASHIAFSRQGLAEYASSNSIEHGLQKACAEYSAWVCVTDGEKGTHLLQGSELHTIAAPKITALDTLGAGDVWHGAFTTRLAQGADEISAIKFANVAAALKCASTGDKFSAPQLQEVTQFIASGYE